MCQLFEEGIRSMKYRSSVLCSCEQVVPSVYVRLFENILEIFSFQRATKVSNLLLAHSISRYEPLPPSVMKLLVSKSKLGREQVRGRVYSIFSSSWSQHGRTCSWLGVRVCMESPGDNIQPSVFLFSEQKISLVPLALVLYPPNHMGSRHRFVTRAHYHHQSRFQVIELL